MDTQSLVTFVTLAKYRNFTRTADALFLAQSTVTNRIGELEKEVGRPLFERNKRKVTLTPEGETFLSYANRIVELCAAGIQDINSLNRYSKSLRLGTTNTIYECYLYPKVSAYMKAHPDHAVKLSMSHSEELIRSIQDHLFDVVYTYVPFRKAGYVCELFAADKLVLVTNGKNPMYADGISQTELPHSKYLYCNFALREVGLFVKELFPPHYEFGFEIDNSLKLIPYLMDFDGISFIPEKLAEPYLKSGALKHIPLKDFDAPGINCYKIYDSGNSQAMLI